MDSEKQDALKRLNAIEGQLGGIRQMVEAEQYCGEILRQTSAVRKAIEQLEVLLLKRHLHHGIPDEIQARRKDAVIQELVQLYQLVGNR